MLLAIDVGNTNIVMGIFKEDHLLADWRIVTEAERTSDEYGILFRNLYASHEISFKDTDGIIVSCVVPPLLDTMEELCEKYFHIKPLMVGPGTKTGMPISYDNPREVGADRIVNAVAAYRQYKQSLIIIDFGTATTFDYISEKGEYEGGAIAPGAAIASDALFHKASKLPRVEFSRPKNVVGKNTVASIQSGIVFGYVGLVEGVVNRMKSEVGSNPRVIATGGLAKLIASEAKIIDEVDELLTLKGLKLIYWMNR